MAAELETQTSFHSSLLEHLEYFMGFKRKKFQWREKKTNLEAKSVLIFLNSSKSKKRNVAT